MARKPKSLQQWLVPRLRRISIYWPGKNQARDKAKRYVSVGKFKNGNPKKTVMYECVECGPDKLHHKHNTAMDHISSVVKLDGFTDWNDYISRLFCEPEGFQLLCHYHHEIKTEAENKQRWGGKFNDYQRRKGRLKKSLTKCKKYAIMDKDARKYKKFYKQGKRRRTKTPFRKGRG